MPWFPHCQAVLWDAQGERCCCTDTPRTAGMLQCRSVGNRLVDGGFARKRGAFLSYVVGFFSLQLPTEVVSPVVQRCDSYRVTSFTPSRRRLRKMCKSTTLLQFLLMASLSLLCSHLHPFPRPAQAKIIIAVQCRATFKLLQHSKGNTIWVCRNTSFWTERTILQGLEEMGWDLGDTAYAVGLLLESRPCIQKLCLPFTSNRRQRVLERKSWDWAALAAGALTVLLFNTDGEPQLASTVIDTIMAGLPGPRGAPGPVGPPGNALSWAAKL